METILKSGVYKILKVFYDNGNSSVHLRGISRATKLNENSASRFLNFLTDSKILISEKSEGARRFFVADNFVKIVFPLFDYEKFEKLPYKIKKSIEDYISFLKSKSSCLILYGSNSRGTANKNSDIDILEINSSKEKFLQVLKKIESQRGVKIQVTRVSSDKLKEAMERDNVIKSAIKTGFPVFGRDFFYELIDNNNNQNKREIKK